MDSLSLAEPLPLTPAAERRGHAAARGALTPVTPFSDAGDAATPSPAPQQQLSPASVNAGTPGTTPLAVSPLVAAAAEADAAAFARRVARLRGDLTAQALLLHCPGAGCGVTLDVPNMRQCMALSCPCGAHFCAWCLRMGTEDATHAHLPSCGGTYGSRTTFRAWHQPGRAARAAQFVQQATVRQPWREGSTEPDVTLRTALLAAAAPDLAAYGIALYELPDGRVSYTLFDVPAQEARGSPDAAFGFRGFNVHPDDGGDDDSEENMDDGDGAAPAPGGCAARLAAEEAAARPAAAWQRLAGQRRAPLAQLREADINILRGHMQAPRVALQAVVMPRGAENAAAAPATPEGPDARAAFAAAAARRSGPQQQRSPLSLMR